MKNNKTGISENFCSCPCGVIGERRQVVPAKPADAKRCGLKLMPVKDILQIMQEDVVTAHQALSHAESAKTVRHILSEIYEYQVDDRIPAHIQHIVADLKGNVRAMHMNDYSRSQMCDDLAQLISALVNAIAEEEHKERVDSVRTIFLVIADHSEEVTRWLEEANQ